MDIIIADDDPPTGLYLKQLLEQLPDIGVLAVANSGAEALRLSKEYQAQVYFMDIDMPDMNGLEVAATIARSQSDVFFIFVTAYPDYALQAFELYSFDYILKPFDEGRIKKTVRKLQQRMINRATIPCEAETIISINTQKGKVLLKTNEISYVESRWPKVFIKSGSLRYCTVNSLHTLEEKLVPYGFFRSHRCYLVNLKAVKEISKSGYTYQILLNSGDKAMLSRSREPELRKLIDRL